MELCYLNRKPYRDRDGNVRVRDKCCGKRTACAISEQPDGRIVKSGGPRRVKKFKTAPVIETPAKKGKKK